MTDKHPVQDIVEPVIDSLGFEVVRIVTIGTKNPTLQIMIERKDRKDIVVDDCAAVSRAVSAVLDEKDPIEGEYSLEVSSPGLDRPLTKPEHFARFAGYETKLETKTEVGGRKRFKGKLLRIDEKQNIYFDMDGTEYVIPFENVGKAKLVLTDELLKQYAEDCSETEI